MRRAVAFVVKGYPRLSEAFIAQEIRALEAHALDIRIISLRNPTDRSVHPLHREIRAPVNYLPEYLYRQPRRVWRGWRAARCYPGYRRALRAWLRDLRRDPTPNRVRRFGQALVLARELPREVGHLHAHFLHTPASVVRYASLISGLRWSCSAHARDIWTSPDWEKREKLAECHWVVTCTSVNRDHLCKLAPAAEQVELLYHGIDFNRFPTPDRQCSRYDGLTNGKSVTILSVGRTVEKKGYADLLAALAALPAELNWRFVHVGGGPLLPRLMAQAKASGLEDRISWLGPQPHDEVLRQYGKADIFALACRVARDGDRDGLPNVLMEAQSQGLACVATRVSAIPELIDHGQTGLLVSEGDSRALCDALERLIVEPSTRVQLGAAGYRRVREHFSFEGNAGRLVAKFQLSLQGSES